MIRLFRLFTIVILLLTLGILLPSQEPQRQIIQGKLTETIDNIMSPIRLMRLQAQKPESTILMPVDGVRVSDVSDTWGAPRSGGRTHQGQDIFAARGTPVRAVVDGFVTRIGDSGLGGKHVFVTGAGGRRYYYAHLNEFAEIVYGDKVTTDTILGFVGNTGNAINTPPHLHFGVYTLSGAINPLPILANRP